MGAITVFGTGFRENAGETASGNAEERSGERTNRSAEEKAEEKTGRITVFFVNNHAVEFDQDKVAFKGGDESFFTLSDAYPAEDLYPRLVADGRSLINWENVCFVKEAKRKTLDED